MDNTGITPVMSVGNGDGFGGSGSFIWLFAILALMWGGNGFFGGNTRGQSATTQDVTYTSAFNQLQDENTAINQNISNASSNVISTIKDAAFTNMTGIRDLEASVSAGFANMQNCCCETLRAIDGVNYNASLNTASINANTTAQTQKILDAIAQNKIESLQSQINALQLQNAVAGVVRYPNGMTYNAGTSPFCNGCGCNNI